MPEGKSLRFRFELDDASFQRVKRALQELTVEAQKFQKALGGAGGASGGIQPNSQFASLMGGGQVGGQRTGAQMQAQSAGGGATATLTSAVQQNVQAFRNLGQFGSQAMKGLGDALKRSIQDQQQSIRGLQQSLEALTRTYERLGGTGGGAVADRVAIKMASIAGKLHTQREVLSGMPQVGGELMPEVPWPGQEPQRSRFAQWWHQPAAAGKPPQWFGGAIQGFAPTTAGGFMRMGGVMVAGAGAALNEYMAGTRMYSNLEAQRSGVVMPHMQRLAAGDITFLQAQRTVMADQARRRDYLAQVGGASRGQLGYGGVVAAAINPLASLGIAIGEISGGFNVAKANAMFGNVVSGVKGLVTGKGAPGGLAALFSTEAAETRMAEDSLTQIENQRNSAAFFQRRMALEGFQASLGDRMQAARILGLGLNLRETGGSGIGRDSYLRREAALTRRGYNVGAQVAAAVQSRQLGLMGEYTDEIMTSGAVGYGQWGGVLAGAARLGGRVGMSGVDLARTALGVSRNTTAGLQLGEMAFQYDPRGLTAGTGFLAAVQGGANLLGFNGNAADMNAVLRVQQGLGAGDQLASGFDPYQQGRNLVAAMKAAPGLSTYGQDYLATGMGFKQLLAAGRGDLTETARGFGVTSSMAKSQLAAIGTSVFERFVDQGRTDPVSSAIRDLQKSGKSLPEFLSSLKTRPGGIQTARALGVFLGQEIGVGEEGGLGLAGLFSGLDTDTLKTGFIPTGKLDKGTKAAMEGKAKQLERQAGETEKDTDTIFKDLAEGADEALQSMTAFGSNMAAEAKVFIQSIGQMTEAVNRATFKISGGSMGSPGATGSAPGTGKKP